VVKTYFRMVDISSLFDADDFSPDEEEDDEDEEYDEDDDDDDDDEGECL